MTRAPRSRPSRRSRRARWPARIALLFSAILASPGAGAAEPAPRAAEAPRTRFAPKRMVDPRLQREAERQLAAARAPEAAIVMSDVKTGRILAWASHGKGRDYVAAPYAPAASLSKIVTATALEEVDPVEPGARQCFSGGASRLGERDLDASPAALARGRCVPYREALGKSINQVFARLAATRLSASDLHAAAKALGFEGPLPSDARLPRSNFVIEDGRLGLGRAAAGFGQGKLSPLAALFAMQTIANGGERIRLQLLGAPADAGRESAGRAMPSAHAGKLTRMLERTTRTGTCVRAFRAPGGGRYLEGVPVAAKTGTLVGGKPRRMFSWFAAFAPSNKPEVAIAVLLANDLRWHTKANIVGRDMLRAYFRARGEPARQPR